MENALEYWKKAVEYNPDNIDAKISLANAYLKTGDIQNAIRKIRGAYSKDKNNTKVLLVYGILLLNNEEYFEALEKLNRALEIDSEYEPAMLAKAECLIKMNKIFEADEILKKYEEKENPDDTSKALNIMYLRVLYNEALIIKENKRELIDNTVELCDKIIALHTDNDDDNRRITNIKDELLKLKEN